MKMNYKKLLTGILGAIITINLVLPVLVFAQAVPVERETPDRRKAPIERNIPTERRAPVDRGFCARIDEIASRIDRQVTNRTTKLQTRQQEGINKLTERRNARNEREIENRVKREGNRSEHYTKLEARATTDAQREAVTAFRAAVETAITARKTAVNAATQSFRQSMDQLIAVRQTAINTAINAFQSSQTAAINQARADCAAGIDARTAHKTFRANIRVAQEQFNNERQAIEARKDLIEPIRASKRQAIEDVTINFKVAMEKARTDLQTAFQTID